MVEWAQNVIQDTFQKAGGMVQSFVCPAAPETGFSAPGTNLGMVQRLSAVWWWSCQMVGVVVLAFLLVWLCGVLIEMCRTRRLLDHLHERVVLITGCDSGFGDGLVRRLDALGVPVVAGCLHPNGVGALSLKADCSRRLQIVPLDVTSEEQVHNAVKTIEKLLTRGRRKLWAVVNNAGILEAGEVELVPPLSFARALAVNTMGTVRITQTFLPLLRRSGGRVVNVASPLGRTAMPMLSPYCMSKAAVISFSDALRVEMQKWGVSVCTVEPTSYQSELNSPENFRAVVSKNIEKIDPKVRESYGQGYKEKCAERLSSLIVLAKPRSSISEVIDELEEACVGVHFKAQRIPGNWEKLVYSILPRLPILTKDIIMYLVFQWRIK